MQKKLLRKDLAGMEKQREQLPDVLKGFAIVMVVLGHCIQEGSGEAFSTQWLYFYDRLYQFIYSFHMPLFMMVSGYLCGGSVHRAASKEMRIQLLKRRILTLLVPVFFWTAAECFHRLILTSAPERTALKRVFTFFYSALNNFWFLWAVFWCFLIVYVMHYYLKDNVVIYGIGFLLLFFIPDGLGLGAYKYMMPYFIVSFYGYGFIRQNAGRLRKWAKLPFVVIMGIVFAALFCFFDANSLIYLTGYKLIGKDVVRQLGIDGYRLVIGFVGSCFFILLWHVILEQFPFLGRLWMLLGNDTMGIYILSGYLIIFVVKPLSNFAEPSYLLNVMEMVPVLLASWGLAHLIGKVPVLGYVVGKAKRCAKPQE